jgi:hypothetical protein
VFAAWSCDDAKVLREGGDDFVEKSDDRVGKQLVADKRGGRDEGKNHGVLDECLALRCGGGAAYDPFVRPTSLRFAYVVRVADAS